METSHLSSGVFDGALTTVRCRIVKASSILLWPIHYMKYHMSSLWNSFWISDHMGKKCGHRAQQLLLPRWSIFNILPLGILYIPIVVEQSPWTCFFSIIFLNLRASHPTTKLCFANLLHYSAYKKYTLFPRIFSDSSIITIFICIKNPSA